VGELGIDLTDLTFWTQGLGAIEDLIEQAEELAADTEKVE
jgi:oligoendopeptidase F